MTGCITAQSMVVRGRLVKPRVLPSGECECDWLRHRLILAHCRSQIDEVVNALPFDTLVFCSVHSLDMKLIDIDHM